MGKLISKRIGLVLLQLFTLLFALFSLWSISLERKAALKELEITIEQVEEFYAINKREEEVSIELFQEDYLNRAYALDYILRNYEMSNKASRELTKLKQVMELNEIHLIDSTGKIVLSSEESSEGRTIQDYSASDTFMKLIESERVDDYVIQVEEASAASEDPELYVAVKSRGENYSVVLIGLSSRGIADILGKNTLTAVVNQTATLESRAVFVYDPEAGVIEGITRNNDPHVEFEGVGTKEEYLEVLKNAKEGALVRINGSLKYLKTKEIEHKVIGAYIGVDVVYLSILRAIIYYFLISLLVFIGVLIMLKYQVKKYILRDIFSIASKVKELLSGNYDVSFETEYPTELREIADILDDWKNSYQHKSERMTKMITSISPDVAIFECLYTINKSFFSDNMQSILGIEDTVWGEISNRPEQFETYLNRLLLNAGGSDQTIEIDNKIVRVISYKDESQFYGLIVDKTEEVSMKNRMEEELHHVQIKSETDPLTRLRNRLGLEKDIKEKLEIDQDKGIMLILDLDNFKSVNDQLGHPEGDKVLTVFTDCLKKSFRKNDVIGRIGGDEFVVFIDTNVPVKILEEKLSSFIKLIHRRLRVYHKRFGLSTSIGVAYVDNITYTYEDLYKCADVALYMAKRLGKSRFYINEENVRCMRNNCIQCSNNCKMGRAKSKESM